MFYVGAIRNVLEINWGICCVVMIPHLTSNCCVIEKNLCMRLGKMPQEFLLDLIIVKEGMVLQLSGCLCTVIFYTCFDYKA